MPFLKALPEDVGEARCDHRLNAHVRQRPGRMLTAGAATEIVARDQDRRARIAGIVEDIARLRPHRLERATSQPGAGDRFQPMGRDDDIRVDILGAPWIGGAGNGGDRIHSIIPVFC